MKRLKSVLAIIVLVAAALTGMYSFAGEKGIMLKLNLKKGQIYESQSVVESEMSVMGIVEKMTILLDYGIDVKEVRANEFMVNFYFSRMKIKNPPRANGEVASGKADTAARLEKIFEGIKDHQFSVVMSSDGKVKEVKGVDEAYAQWMEKFGRADLEFFTQRFQFVGEEKIKDQLEQTFQFLPYKEVKVGDSWRKELRPFGDIPVKMNTTYKVVEIRGDRVILDVDGTFDPGFLSAEPQFRGMTVKGGMTGPMEILKDSGFPINYSNDINLKVEKDGVSFMNLKMKGAVSSKLK